MTLVGKSSVGLTDSLSKINFSLSNFSKGSALANTLSPTSLIAAAMLLTWPVKLEVQAVAIELTPVWLVKDVFKEKPVILLSSEMTEMSFSDKLAEECLNLMNSSDEASVAVDSSEISGISGDLGLDF